MKKKYRLKKNHEIAFIVQNKKRVSSSCFTLYYYQNKEQGNKYAISVGKKYGNAVERNYAKRVVREAIRPLLELLPNVLVVIVVKTEFKNHDFHELKAEITKLMYLIKDKIKYEERKNV